MVVYVLITPTFWYAAWRCCFTGCRAPSLLPRLTLLFLHVIFWRSQASDAEISSQLKPIMVCVQTPGTDTSGDNAGILWGSGVGTLKATTEQACVQLLDE
jgi:hypothetical protein